MTVKQAEKQGFIFTGKYESGYEVKKVIEEAKRIRKLGYKAVTVEESNGKSVYAEKAYIDYAIAQDYKKRLEVMPSRKQWLLEKYENELKQLEAEEERYKAFIAKVEGN